MMKMSRRHVLQSASLALAAPAIIAPTTVKADDMYGPPNAKKGNITYLPNFSSKHVSPRDVAIWVPDPAHHDGPLPVIYAGSPRRWTGDCLGERRRSHRTFKGI